MRKLYILGLIALAAVIIGLAWAEQMTFSTYYPAPHGVYNNFAVNKMAVDVTGVAVPTEYAAMNNGDVHIGRSLIVGRGASSGFAFDEGATTQDGDVLIKGNVGIGTTSPKTKLDVDGLIRTARYSPSTRPGAEEDNKGAIYYDTDDDAMYYSNGSDWVPMGGGGGWVHSGELVYSGAPPTGGIYQLNGTGGGTNLSTIVGSNYALVMLKVRCDQDVYFKPGGDSNDYRTSSTRPGANTIYTGAAKYGIVVVETNSNGVVDFSTSGGQPLTVRLLGYIPFT